jgi:Fe-S cluster assembly protein SufB
MSRFVPIKPANPANDLIVDDYEHGYSSPTTNYHFISQPGISPKVVDAISSQKQEPQWLRRLRHQALDVFLENLLPSGAAISRKLITTSSTTTSNPPNLK